MSAMKIQPLGARVLIRPLVEDQARTGSGLFINAENILAVIHD